MFACKISKNEKQMHGTVQYHTIQYKIVEALNRSAIALIRSAEALNRSAVALIRTAVALKRSVVALVPIYSLFGLKQAYNYM